MNATAIFQPAVFAFAAGMALAWTAALVLAMRRDEKSTRRTWLASFAAALAAAEGLGLVADGNDHAPLRLAQLAISSAGFLALIEFGRRELRTNYRALNQPWVYAAPVSLAAFQIALRGADGLEAASAYVLAPLGGLLAAAAMAQRVCSRGDGRWGLPLAAAAILFFSLGSALSIEALKAFAALGLLVGVWRDRRDESPFADTDGALVRLRAPGAFVALVLLGVAVLVSTGYGEQAGSTVVQAVAAGDTGDGAAAGSAIETVPLDSRQLARERAAAQRLKQGLGTLAVIVVVAAVWVGLSHMQRRM